MGAWFKGGLLSSLESNNGCFSFANANTHTVQIFSLLSIRDSI
jgi:hypothetical protein